MQNNRVAALALVVSLAACGGGGGGSGGGADGAVTDTGLCHAIAQSLVSSSPTTGSSLANPENAVDGNFSTFATLTPAAANGGGSIRGAAASQQAAGSAPGVDLTTPSTGSFTFTVTTYLGGSQQETVQLGPQNYALGSGSQSCAPAGNGDCLNGTDGHSFFGLISSKPYDSFQVTVAVSGTTAPVQLRELCVH